MGNELKKVEKAVIRPIGGGLKEVEKAVIRPTIGGDGLGGILIPHQGTRVAVGRTVAAAAAGAVTGGVGACLTGSSVAAAATSAGVASAAATVQAQQKGDPHAWQVHVQVPLPDGSGMESKKRNRGEEPLPEQEGCDSSEMESKKRKRGEEPLPEQEGCDGYDGQEKAQQPEGTRAQYMVPSVKDIIIQEGHLETSLSLGPVQQEQVPGFWQKTASVVLDLIPFVGSIKSIDELVTGRDRITDEKVHRLLSSVSVVAGILPGGTALLKGGSKVAKSLDDVNPQLLDHIFRDAKKGGHVNPATDASKSRFWRLFEHVASDVKNLDQSRLPQGAVDAGVKGFFKQYREGEVWVHVRNGEIQNAGVNHP